MIKIALLMLCIGLGVVVFIVSEGDFMSHDIIGQRLPSMILPSSSGGQVKIPDDLLGSYTVLFFYPKDQTPGCTKEACTFRDNTSEFKKAGAKVYGVSADSIDSHHRFIAKHELNFPLISDAKKELAKALGVGSFLGILSRDTFIIDPEGKVLMLWRKVNATKTVLESLEELKKLSATPTQL